MRAIRTILLAALPGLVWAGGAAAQSWPNDVNPRNDSINAAVGPLERMLDAAPRAPVATRGFATATAAPPIPMLDWTPPPAAAPAPAPRRPARRVARRTAPQPAPQAPREDTAWLEQRMASREREMDRLRQQVEQDRRLLQTQRETVSGRQVVPAAAGAAPQSNSTAPATQAQGAAAQPPINQGASQAPANR